MKGKIKIIRRGGKEIWQRISHSFAETNAFDEQYHLAMSSEQRLSDVQFCRRQFFNLKGDKNASGKGLRRIIRIVKRK